jgi:uncharacterized protein (TIGR03085 family)
VTDLAVTERASLADLLDQLGPNAPTLCEGWQTRDLASHLVLRERRPDAIAGIVIHPLSGWTRRVQNRLAQRNFSRLVDRLRGGPPRWSLVRLRRIDEGVNNVEFFVHHEDIRRAQPGWQPRTLGAAANELLWRRTQAIARHALHTDHGVELVRSDTGERHVARSRAAGEGVLVVTGTPQELLLYVFGRFTHALVERNGAAEAFATLEES